MKNNCTFLEKKRFGKKTRPTTAVPLGVQNWKRGQLLLEIMNNERFFSHRPS
jgi:putative AlgH/UPF0301 family transcriptional regulator